MPTARRDFIRQTAAAAAAAVAGIPLPGLAQAPASDEGRRRRQVVEGAVPLLRHRLRRDGGA